MVRRRRAPFDIGKLPRGMRRCPWLLASAHAAVGVKDEALSWLDRAIERGMINYPFLSEHDWYLDNVRGEHALAS